MSNQNITALEQQTDGSFKEIITGKKLKFTPASPYRWYRVVRIVSTNEDRKVISGSLKIYANHLTRKTYASTEIDVTLSSRGTITQTSYTTVGDPHVIYIRVARNQGVNSNELVVDILTGASAGQEITLESFGPLFPDFEENPEIVGSVLQDINRSNAVESGDMPWDEFVVSQHAFRYGLDTTNTTSVPTAPYFEGDVDFYWNQNDPEVEKRNYSILNLDLDTWVTVVIPNNRNNTPGVNSVGLLPGRYAGKVISRSSTSVSAPNGVTEKWRVTIRLRGLNPSTNWTAANKGFAFIQPSVPNVPDVNANFTVQSIVGGFNGLMPDPPSSSDAYHAANILQLGQGLITNKLVRSHHGHYQDPDQPLRIGGRAGYLHALNLLGGAGRFTVSTDHFHLFFSGGLNSSAGFHTPQHYKIWPTFTLSGRHAWNKFQIQNSNSNGSNEIFLGGLTEFSFGTTLVNNNNRYGVDTSRVEQTGTGDNTNPADVQNTSPGPPRYDAEVDFYFNTLPTNVTEGTYVTVNFPVGHAGIAAAILSGKVIAPPSGPLTAPDGATGKYKLIIRLEGLTSTEWYPEAAGFVTNPLRWSMSSAGEAIENRIDLELHPTRRDKIIVTYSTPHEKNEGQVVVFNLLQRSFIVNDPGISNGVVSKVISPTKLEILLGTCRRSENLNLLGMFKFSNHASGSPSYGTNTNLYWVNYSHPPKDQVYRVKLRSTNNLPLGLEPDRDYWMRLNQIYPQFFFNLFDTLQDALNNTNAVTVNYAASYGFHYLVFYTAYKTTNNAGDVVLDLEQTPNLGANGWDIHEGNTDSVHQQTFGDVGWYLHRNVYPNTNGVAQGVITQGVFGGLCEVPYLAKKAFSYGWNSAAEEDDTVAIGLNIRNNTQKSIELGASNNFKLRLEENKISTVGTGIIDLQNSTIINSSPQLINQINNFSISGNSHGRMIMANSSAPITGTIMSGNATGFNLSIIQVGTAQIRITGDGDGIKINSYYNQYRTAGQFAKISLIHTGNNGYIMYGNIS